MSDAKTTKTQARTVTKRHVRGVITGDQADHERRWVACSRLRWGDGWIEPGQEVPRERGRRYEALWRAGKIAPFMPLPEAT